jgi:hypothetical protein
LSGKHLLRAMYATGARCLVCLSLNAFIFFFSIFYLTWGIACLLLVEQCVGAYASLHRGGYLCALNLGKNVKLVFLVSLSCK